MFYSIDHKTMVKISEARALKVVKNSEETDKAKYSIICEFGDGQEYKLYEVGTEELAHRYLHALACVIRRSSSAVISFYDVNELIGNKY